MEIPVYLFTGFLDSGKTRFIQETLSDPNFFANEKIRMLVILCEEGEEELEPSKFASKDVFVEIIDSERRLNPDKLDALRKKHRANRVMIEYNGMWMLNSLFNSMPEGWFVYQEMMFADASTINVYNANMRNMVVDKLSSCDFVVFNRCEKDTDIQELHKLVRGVSRRTEIIYERTDGTAAYDDIEDPLPFDTEAPFIEIGESDYALFYRDLSENLKTYDGKTVTFLGSVRRNSRLPKEGFIIGRPIMTCCVEDIAFGGLYCENGADRVTVNSWVQITAEVEVKYTKVYGKAGPVLHLTDVKPADEPADPVATFY
ncbi:MAG: hypothetical protein IJL71_07030 [Oscillospiraceae bacterium]|nr:hypothetical protein [Oscillospiraceae bacterium]